MKAFVIDLYDYSDFSILIHGQTREEAKYRAIRVWPDLEPPDYTDIQARRVRSLDDVEFTNENTRYYFIHENDENDFINFCDCPLCKK